MVFVLWVLVLVVLVFVGVGVVAVAVAAAAVLTVVACSYYRLLFFGSTVVVVVASSLTSVPVFSTFVTLQVLSSVAAQLGPRFLMFDSMADTFLEEAGAEEQAYRCDK